MHVTVIVFIAASALAWRNASFTVFLSLLCLASSSSKCRVASALVLVCNALEQQQSNLEVDLITSSCTLASVATSLTDRQTDWARPVHQPMVKKREEGMLGKTNDRSRFSLVSRFHVEYSISES